MKIQQNVQHIRNTVRKSFIWSGVATICEAFFPAIVGVASCVLGAPHYGLWTGFLVVVQVFWISFFVGNKLADALPD